MALATRTLCAARKDNLEIIRAAALFAEPHRALAGSTFPRRNHGFLRLFPQPGSLKDEPDRQITSIDLIQLQKSFLRGVWEKVQLFDFRHWPSTLKRRFI
jgi:hypothetical protein